jgi:nucleoid DNA-binding protein
MIQQHAAAMPPETRVITSKEDPFDLTELVDSLEPADEAQAREYRRLLEQAFDNIAEQIANRRRVQLRGFGSFYTQEFQPRTYVGGINPTPVFKPLRLIVKFTPGDPLRELIQEKTGLENIG